MKSVKGAAAVVLAVGMLLSTTAWAAEKEASSVREVQGGLPSHIHTRASRFRTVCTALL